MSSAKGGHYDLEKTTIREMISHRLRALGVTKYRLMKSGEVSLAKTTLYRFLSGEADTMVTTLEEILKACGLRVVPDDATPEWVVEARAMELAAQAWPGERVRFVGISDGRCRFRLVGASIELWFDEALLHETDRRRLARMIAAARSESEAAAAS